MRNPFADDIFSAGTAGEPGVPMGSQAAVLTELEQATAEVGGVMGRAVVVTAPRAGYGKSHMMSRFAEGLAGRVMVVPLTFDLESPPRWMGVLEEVVEKLHRDHGHRPGLTVMDEAARFLFARVNQRLIETGKIPCTHPAEAVAALDRNYLEMFDFGDPGQVVARWFSEHFENLIPLTSAGLAPEAAVDEERVAHWLRVLVAYAQSVDELPSRRLEALKWAIHTRDGAGFGGGGAMVIQDSGTPEQAAKESLRDLGRLLGIYRPLVFVIDHLDIFYRDGAAGLKLAYFVSELRRLVPRSLSVVCVNQDVWQATFQSQLPSALEDRMSGGFMSLNGVTREEAEALVRARLAATHADPSVVTDFVARLGLDAFIASHAGQAVSPRAVLRFAARCWAEMRPSLGTARPAMSRPSSPARVSPMVMVPEPSASAHPPTPPASSVVGDEALDSISVALQAMVAGVAATEIGPPGVGMEGTFQRLRENLERLRPTPSGMPASTSPFSPTNGHMVEGGDALSDAFLEQVRRRAEVPVPPTLDLEGLGRLLRFVGDHFPAVRANELGVPGTSGTALQWLSPDAEILIGLESGTRPIFWSALTAHAAARFKLNGGVPVKVVAFMEPDWRGHPASTARLADDFTLDLVTPSPMELHHVAAACDVLEALDARQFTAEAQDVSALFARALEPFWRRLTRLTSVPAGASDC